MLKAALRFVATVFLCVVISVYAMHLVVLITDLKAVTDGQYAMSFMVTGAFGWLAGIGFFFVMRRLEKGSAGSFKRGLLVCAVYALILVIAAVVCEQIRFEAPHSSVSVFLIGYLPLLFIFFPVGLPLLFLSPATLLIELAVFIPPTLFLARARRRKAERSASV